MSDWQEITPAQLEMIRSCGPGEVCFLWGDEMVKTTKVRLGEVLKQAFEQAFEAATEMGRGYLDGNVEFSADDLEPGDLFVRVVMRDEMGREAAGIGMIANPAGGLN